MHKFMQLTPFFIEKMMGWQRKQFVVKMELLPESKQLKIKCLGHDQQIDKIVELENLVPVTWEDYFQASKRRLFAIPPFVDVDMVYYNQSQDEFYLFDNTGKWDSEGIEHPVLSLAQNFNEKKWFDSVRII
ncbi:hypothetical protein PPERSA_08794 [Pseudocohnilembus persalinus]|uniref:Uncharacterized protein n=1 Tax=Pseudocohnilembus persalinus TaxID=266149 RepID=A0A0V0R7L5_PSEPJ|nr:hypothetical protein PPERSA_08794 [Pseudocohnilembus persalinus]|eukprot:KRX10492.1 hypothetical protein PPERSA_08794 [Pseudocohnilembus persalinus]